jgi:chromosome segregation ATPase
MSTQLDTAIVDLDRTDELPVLDVEAYEAKLAAGDNSLSRTDTWAVESLRAIDEIEEESEDAVLPASPAQPSVPAEALTINVERILRRIAELEAELVATHETNARLEKDCEALLVEQAEKDVRIEALRTDNTRLCDDRLQSDAVAQGLEQQLRERAESIAALEKSLATEKDLATHLSQQLAAKLMDCQKAQSTIELRNRTIEEVTREGAGLSHRLQREIAASADLTARLVASEQLVHESRALLLERSAVMETKDAQLVQAQGCIHNLTEERDSLRAASAQLDARAAEMEARAADFEQKNVELAQLRSELAAARAEVQSQATLLKERADELGLLYRKCNEHETAIGEFEHTMRVRSEEAEEVIAQLRAARDEQATMGVQLDNASARTKKLTDEIFSRDNQIAALQAELAAHTEALATIRRDVNRIGARAVAEIEVEHMLEPVEHEGPMLYLNGEVLTLGRTSDNDIVIPSKLVSRCHARLLVGPTGVIVEDANSTNGCYVNGELVRQHLLHDGDVLELGDLRYRLRTRTKRDTRVQDSKLRQLPPAPRRTITRMAT